MSLFLDGVQVRIQIKIVVDGGVAAVMVALQDVKDVNLLLDQGDDDHLLLVLDVIFLEVGTKEEDREAGAKTI